MNLAAPLLALTAATGVVLALAGNITPERRQTASETLCGEVQYELTQQVLSGMLSESDADRIVARCIKLYGHQPRDPR